MRNVCLNAGLHDIMWPSHGRQGTTAHKQVTHALRQNPALRLLLHIGLCGLADMACREYRKPQPSDEPH